MLPTKTILPDHVADLLMQRFNIRTVEQFLHLMERRPGAEALAAALGRPIAELEDLARSIREHHPEVDPSPSPPRDYPLGYKPDGK